MGDNIRTDLEEVSINVGNWVDSAKDTDYWRALVNVVSSFFSYGFGYTSVLYI